MLSASIPFKINDRTNNYYCSNNANNNNFLYRVRFKINFQFMPNNSYGSNNGCKHYHNYNDHIKFIIQHQNSPMCLSVVGESGRGSGKIPSATKKHNNIIKFQIQASIVKQKGTR